MLKSRLRKTETVWNGDLKNFRVAYAATKRRLAFKLQNPDIKRITLHSFRHYYASKLYHDTKDILLVQRKLGHRSILNTMIYTHLIDWQTDQWIVKRPSTSEEEDDLIQTGFEYVRFDEKLETPIYRKRK